MLLNILLLLLLGIQALRRAFIVIITIIIPGMCTRQIP